MPVDRSSPPPRLVFGVVAGVTDPADPLRPLISQILFSSSSLARQRLNCVLFTHRSTPSNLHRLSRVSGRYRPLQSSPASKNDHLPASASRRLPSAVESTRSSSEAPATRPRGEETRPFRGSRSSGSPTITRYVLRGFRGGRYFRARWGGGGQTRRDPGQSGVMWRAVRSHTAKVTVDISEAGPESDVL